MLIANKRRASNVETIFSGLWSKFRKSLVRRPVPASWLSRRGFDLCLKPIGIAVKIKTSAVMWCEGLSACAPSVYVFLLNKTMAKVNCSRTILPFFSPSLWLSFSFSRHGKIALFVRNHFLSGLHSRLPLAHRHQWSQSCHVSASMRSALFVLSPCVSFNQQHSRQRVVTSDKRKRRKIGSSLHLWRQFNDFVPRSCRRTRRPSRSYSMHTVGPIGK